MFIDKTKIFVKAGSGGNGAIAFHREKYVAADPTAVTAATAARSSCAWMTISPR